MSWRRQVNAGLAKAGYKLVKADGAATARPAPRRRSLPRYYDDEAKQIIRAVKPRTMTAYEKLYTLIIATRYITDHRIPGAMVECGVWRGGSMQAIAKTLLARGVSDRELHLFDTFEGMTEPSEKDLANDGTLASEMLATRPRTAKMWAIAGLDDVQAGMAETGYPSERVHFHAGPVEQTIPEHAPGEIALLRLDTDWYESTRHELQHLYDRVPAGGVVMIDDYNAWQGARQAVDEFLDDTGASLLLVPMATGRVAVKP